MSMVTRCCGGTDCCILQSLIQYSEETKKGQKDFGTVSISAEELKALRAEAAKSK